jgi:hypothetical protein
MHPVDLLCDFGRVESHFNPLVTLAVLVQDMCMVFAKCTIGTEIILDAPDSTPGDEAQVDAHFGLFGDSANLNAI